MRRALLPLALIFAGVALLSGCIYVPIPERTVYGTNVGARVGPANSSKPVRIGRISRNDVLRVLGEPAQMSPNGRELTYTWGVQTGVWVWPLCGHPQGAGREITLKFDDAGVLRDTEVPKEYDGPVQRHSGGGEHKVLRWGLW